MEDEAMAFHSGALMELCASGWTSCVTHRIRR